MKSKPKVRDRVRDGTQNLRKSTKKLNATIMQKVKIKRVKRDKKKTTTGEKVLAAVGLGSTLLGGAGAVSAQPKTTQFVRTQTNEKGSKTQGIKDMLKEIFGVKQASAATTVDAAQKTLTDAQTALSNFDAWVASATADIPKFAPEDQAQRQQDIDAEVARTRPGLVKAVDDAQAAYNQAVKDNQGPQEGDTKSEGGINYTFYQGNWVINNGQTKTDGGFTYGSQGNQWILLDGQTKTENGITYISSGGTWVQQTSQTQAPKIGDTQKGSDGYDYVFSNSIYPTGAWTLVDGQTKTENGVTYKVQGGTWVAQAQTQTNQGPQENDTKVENGKAYIFKSGAWVLQTPENIPKITYEVWRTDQGVGAYFNQQYGFVTVTTDGRMIDQNGNTINLSDQALQNNFLLQGLMFQLHSADINNTVKNPDFKPVTSLTGQALLDQANNGSVDWNKLTATQQQELADHFGNHPELLPQTVAPGSPLAYMLGLGTSADVNNATVQQNAAAAGYELKNGQWVKKTTTTTTTPTTTTTTTTGNNQKDLTVVYGQGNLDYSVVDNGNGTFSVVYQGKVLVTGSSRADIDAARANYPFLYATPEAVILSNLSSNFNNVFAVSNNTVKVDLGVRPSVDTATTREVWRDSQGNSAAYFGELGGRVYYDAASQKIFWEKPDGSIVDITNNPSIVSPQTSANIIKVLSANAGTAGTNVTITGFADGKYPATYNLLTEMGVGVDKGPTHAPTVSTLTPGTYQQFWNLEGFTQSYMQNNHPFTVSVATDASGQKVYTFSTTVNGQQVNKTFVGTQQLNSFLNSGFSSADAYLAMSPQDQAVFNAAINSRLKYPEIGLGSRLPVPGTNDTQTITFIDSSGRLVSIVNGYNPTNLSFKEDAEYFQKMFPGSKIVDGGWAGVGMPGLTVQIDPNDPRRNFLLELPDGTQMNVGLMAQSMYSSLGVNYLGGVPASAGQYFQAPSDGSVKLPAQTANGYTAPGTTTGSTGATGTTGTTQQNASLPSITKVSSQSSRAFLRMCSPAIPKS